MVVGNRQVKSLQARQKGGATEERLLKPVLCRSVEVTVLNTACTLMPEALLPTVTGDRVAAQCSLDVSPPLILDTQGGASLHLS